MAEKTELENLAIKAEGEYRVAEGEYWKAKSKYLKRTGVINALIKEKEYEIANLNCELAEHENYFKIAEAEFRLAESKFKIAMGKAKIDKSGIEEDDLDFNY